MNQRRDWTLNFCWPSLRRVLRPRARACAANGCNSSPLQTVRPISRWGLTRPSKGKLMVLPNDVNSKTCSSYEPTFISCNCVICRVGKCVVKQLLLQPYSVLHLLYNVWQNVLSCINYQDPLLICSLLNSSLHFLQSYSICTFSSKTQAK